MKKLISRNPANNTIVGEVAITSLAEIKRKVKEAHAVKKEWKALGAQKRAELLRPLLAIFEQHKAEIDLLTVREMGKPISECQDGSDLNYFRHFLAEGPGYLADEMTFQNEKSLHKIVYEPRGVVASIVPWNFPLSNFLWGVIPNLIAGNPVIVKHSEECPLVGKLCEELMTKINLPRGVFAEIYGDAKVGAQLLQENIDMIWFTGSSAAGKKLFAIAGKKQIKSILEMGGSNPAMIFEDADLDAIVPKIVEARFSNCGQICDAVKRVIVHRSLFKSLVEKLAEQVQKIKIGDPELPATQMGPLAAMRQLKLLEAQVKEAIRTGAKVITGGKRVPNLSGAYYLPTILTQIKPSMRVWKEETFGPVLPVVPFDTESEAIALANDTIYGLGAVIYSKDLVRAKRVASQIDAGTVDINEGNHWRPSNPFGGCKASGMGCEHGRLGFQELCQFKLIAE